LLAFSHGKRANNKLALEKVKNTLHLPPISIKDFPAPGGFFSINQIARA
jgi:hypothetical protein